MLMSGRAICGGFHEGETMLECLIMTIIWAIVALIVVYILELILAQFVALPGQVIILIRLLVALLLLLYVLACTGLLAWPPPRLPR